MATIYDIEPAELIEKTAEELKKCENIKPPQWVDFVKTGAHKERPPRRSDWWYIRAASVLRTIYKRGPIGVSKLRTKYGGKKRRGHKPEEFRKASGNILRKILQQLEKQGLVKQVEKGVHKGRIITPKGKSLLDKVASKNKKAETPAVKKEIKEEPKKEKVAEGAKKRAPTPKEPEKVPTAAELAEKKKDEP